MSHVPPWLWALLAGLIFLSGFFSSAETALFSLTPAQRAGTSPLARSLLSRPRSLLISILLCNLVVNLLFFAFATRLLPEGSTRGGVAVGLGALLAVLILGEILPKTLGLRARLGVSRFAAPGLSGLVLLTSPLAGPLIRLLEWIHQKLVQAVPRDAGVSAEALAMIMEKGAEEGDLLSTEADLLAEIVELDQIRVREIMTPRVDALFLDIAGHDRAEKVSEALGKRHTWLPVIDGNPDGVLGRVRVRDLLLRPDRPIRQLVMPVKFVPEVASAMSLLRALREDRTGEAVVIDEWGGTAGVVTAEDVLEEIVGDLRQEGEERVPAVVPLGEGRYRVAGGLAIRDWNQQFGLAVVPTEFETVGGFVTALLGRIPRAGDVARVENLVLEVHEVRGRRVLTVDIGVDSSAARPAGAVR